MANKLEEARRIINEVDLQMAELFVKRMRAAELVCEHKMEYGLPILDQKREDAVIERNSALVDDEILKGYYIDKDGNYNEDNESKIFSVEIFDQKIFDSLSFNLNVNLSGNFLWIIFNCFIYSFCFYMI